MQSCGSSASFISEMSHASIAADKAAVTFETDHRWKVEAVAGASSITRVRVMRTFDRL